VDGKIKMKKTFLSVIFLLASVFAFAATDYRDTCRRIIYAVKPVESIGALDEATLNRLGRFALGIPVAGQETLNENDAELFSFLSTIEMSRRKMSPDEFSLYLQEEHERLVPLITGRGDTSIYIKEDGWIDLFRLNLIFAN
jgi:hypothetical protein